MTGTPNRLRVGLAGAGAWARAVHGPTLAAGPETELSAVWSRTEAAAAALGAALGVPVAPSFDALLATSDAVAFAVPPEVQPALAVRAARAGKAVLLEKPLAGDPDTARRVADEIADAGVGSLLVLTYRFAPQVRRFLAEASRFPALGGRACFLSGAFLGGAFAHGWRLERGALLDVGPHVLDLVDAALGPIGAVAGRGDPQGWISLVCEHEGGAVSEIAICTRVAGPSRTEVELFGPEGTLSVDGRAGDRADNWAALRRDFAAVARDPAAGHPCDARRGALLAELVARAEAALR